MSILLAPTGPKKNSMPYRPDVDGLRAIAVLLVIFEHLQTRITGGYVGVDVFFVISGYLISSVILSDMDSGRFSVAHFYERRIRRIFPALMGMLLGCSVLTFFLSVPSESDAFARSMLAALFSGSNFLFWQETGYFGAANELKPLLHTWSLAVEEQFYILFPLFLLAAHRWFPNKLRTAIWSITAVSFILACICVQLDATAAFYFAPLRAWELLIGTIVSQHYVPAVHGKVKRNFAAILGLLLIVVPSVIYTDKTHFPGLAAVPPCVGAALLIAAGETGNSLIGSLLAWRPMVFVGLISYSLYLWHWPILVFQKLSYVRIPHRVLLSSVLLVSLLVATLSWLCIETPFRTGRFRPNLRSLLLVTGITAAFIVLVGAFAIQTKGFPSRFPAEANNVDRYTDYGIATEWRDKACFINPTSTLGPTFADFDKPKCLSEDPTRKQYLLVGDSHAAHLYPGLVAVFPELNISGNSRQLQTFPDSANRQRQFLCEHVELHL